MPTTDPTEAVAPDQVLIQMLMGMWTTRSIGAAVRLRIPDELHGGPKQAEEIAAAVGAEPAPVRRLLRALASLGVFARRADGRFELTPLGDRLRDVPGTLRNFFIAETDRVHWESWQRLEAALRTGQPQPQHALGTPLFDYYSRHRDDGEQFGRAMQDVSAMVVQGVLEHYGFRGVGTAVDIGGGNGSLLLTILEREPSLSGIVFDLPYIQAQAEAHVASRGLANRCRFEAGNFFEAVPAADLYLMKFIIHDWTDEESVRILTRCREAARPGGRVLLVEMLVPADNSSPMVTLMDLNMLVMTGGQERTIDEYNALLERAGFRPSRTVLTGTPFSLVEGVV